MRILLKSRLKASKSWRSLWKRLDWMDWRIHSCCSCCWWFLFSWWFFLMIVRRTLLRESAETDDWFVCFCSPCHFQHNLTFLCSGTKLKYTYSYLYVKCKVDAERQDKQDADFGVLFNIRYQWLLVNKYCVRNVSLLLELELIETSYSYRYSYE